MPDAKTIRIFIASSIVEFEKDRLELMNHVAQLNKSYEPRGVRFELVGCENMSNALALSRKQDDYNKQIRNSRYVYVLVGERMGGYTEEEFDVALDQFERTGSEPRIYTYFKVLPEGRADDSVAAFMERLDRQLGHFYSMYTDLDSVKLNMIMELMRDPDVGGVVEFEDGRALLNGQDMMSLENVPIYGGNDSLQAMRAELSKLEAECARLKARVAETMDEGAMMEFSAAAKRKADLADQIHAMEMAVLENMNLIASKAQSGEEVDPREREAARLVSEGDYRGANAVLKDAQWDKDIDAAAEVEQGLREKARQYVSSRRALASNLRSMGVTEKTAPEIEAAYERACEAAGRWQVGIDVFGEYTEFLRVQRMFKKALGYARENVHRHELADARDALAIGRAHALLGTIYHLNQMDGPAEIEKKHAIEVLDGVDGAELDLAYARASLGATYWKTKRHAEAKAQLEPAIAVMEGDERADREELSSAYNRMGVVANGLDLLEDAEAYHKKAARIREQMAQSGDPKKLRDLSISFHNLGFLYSKEKRYAEAEEAYARALGIRERIAADNPAAFEPGVATTIIQLGKNYRRMGRFEEAERAIARGLDIRRRLLPMDVGVFPSGIAVGLAELAICIREARWEGRYDEACALFEEAIAIREKLAADNPSHHEADLSDTCGEYARLLALMGRDQQARELFERALALRRPRFEADPDVHGRMFAAFSHDFAAFLLDRGLAGEALEHAQRAHGIRSSLSAAHPEVYADELAASRDLLARALAATGSPEEPADLTR